MLEEEDEEAEVLDREGVGAGMAFRAIAQSESMWVEDIKIDIIDLWGVARRD